MYMWRLICVLSVVHCCLAARILGVFPTPSISHQVVFRALTIELANRGHELVVVTTDPAFSKDNPHPNITEIDAHDVSYGIWQEALINIAEAERNNQRSIIWQYEVMMKNLAEVFDAQMDLPETKSLIENKDEHFDLILVESIIRVAQGLRHRFKAPVIGVSSFAAFICSFDLIGTPTHPLLYPDFFHKHVDMAKMSILDKIKVIYQHLRQKYYDAKFLVNYHNAIARKHFGSDTPDVTELESEQDMLFLNVNPIWHGTRPVPPSVIYMGGNHLEPPKELPSDLKSLLDNSTRGVIYMSLGSNIKSVDLREDKQRIFLEVFQRIPYDVIWKWETNYLPGKPDNVHISKWLPQADLLRHRNIKAFITQAGLQSTDEAIHAGVPLIGIPFLGDQEFNAAHYEYHGVGIALDIRTLTVDKLESAIINVVSDESYRKNVRRMSRLLQDQPTNGMERAVWWTEHVLRHGGARHLRSPAAGVSFIHYFMLDVIAALILPLFIIITIIYKVLHNFRLKLKVKTH